MRERKPTNKDSVLAILQRHAKPLSAYDILAEMREANPKAAPPTVYRALATLIETGCVHRVESLNAFVACQSDGHQCPSIMSICDDCGEVEEMDAPKLLADLSSVVGKTGFEPVRHVVEVHGVCASCGQEGTRP